MRPVALVTGGTRGIGLGIALALARNGFNLLVCGKREAACVADVLQPLRAIGTDVEYCQADVSVSADRAQLVAEALKRFGALNVLVNNAGIAPKQRTDILDATEESFEEVLRVNLQGPYFLTQSVARCMIEQKKTLPSFKGCIVNVSSISATVASVSRGEYCISKAGVAMATTLWAVRMSAFEIPVYEVRPGVIATDMTAGVQEKYDTLIANGLTLQKRWGQPDDIGKAVVMLARGELAYSTGQVIQVDGGLTVHRL